VPVVAKLYPRFSLFVLCLVMALATGLLAGCSDEPQPTPALLTPPAPRIATTVFATQPPEPTATPTLAPTLTPNANTLLAQAERAAHNGDNTQAEALYAQLIPLLGTQSEQAAQANFHLARQRIGSRDVAQLANAIALLDNFVAPAALQADTQILRARAYHLSGRNNEAIAQYAAALSPTSVLSPYLNVWMGDAYMQLNQPISAVLPYQNAIPAAPSNSIEFDWREKLALAHRLAGQRAEAAAQYQLILSRAKIPTYQARIKWELAQEQVALGQSPQALLNDLITNHPRTTPAFEALKLAVDSGLPVDELQRGIVNYHAGNFPAARDAFRRAIAAPANREDEIRYWAALNYISLNLPDDAVRNLDQTIAANTSPQRVTEAWAEKAKLYANLENKEQGVASFSGFAQVAQVGEANAAHAYAIGLAFERRLWFAEAIEAFVLADSLAVEPKEPNALPTYARGGALAKAAALSARIGNPSQAISLTQNAASKYAINTNPLALLWLGKAQLAVGDVVSGQATLQALVQAKPDDYAGVRANELLGNLPPMAQPISPLLIGEGPGVRSEAEQWLFSWMTPTRALTNTTLQQDVRFVRGTQLAQLGFEPEALGEFGALLSSYVAARDPLALFQLSLHLRELRLYRLSISSADALMRLSPFPTPAALPQFLLRLLYPIYYDDLVLQYAHEFNLDPLLVFSVIRQESLFESFAESSAAAQGLMQVVPPTGAEIAGELGWPPNYSPRDLTRPYVSVRFGAYYLSKQKRIFEGDVYAALAGYNGGAGNSLRWRERSGGDPDVFFSVISFDETKLYVRNIATNYAMYRRIYLS
jgi:soluble lytic murein transglycosylase